MNKTNMVTLSCLGLLMTEVSHASWVSHLEAIADKRPTVAVQPVPVAAPSAPIQPPAPRLQAPQQQAAPVAPAPQTHLLNQIADLQATIARMQADAEIQAEANEFIRMADEESAEDMQQALRQNNLLLQAAERDLGEAELDLANKAHELAQLSDHNAEIESVYKARIEEHRKDYFDARGKKKAYKARLKTLSATIEEMMGELEGSKEGRSSALEFIGTLQQEAEELQKKNCELEDRIAELMEGMAEKETPEDFDGQKLLTENMALLKIMTVLDAERDLLQAKLKEIERDAEAADKQLKTELSTKEIHKTRIATLNADRNALKEKNEELLKLISRLKLKDHMVVDESTPGNIRLGAILALAHDIKQAPNLNYSKINASLDQIEAEDAAGTMTPDVNNSNHQGPLTPSIQKTVSAFRQGISKSRSQRLASGSTYRPDFLTPEATDSLTPVAIESQVAAEALDIAERIKVRRSQGPAQLEASPQTVDNNAHDLSLMLVDLEHPQRSEDAAASEEDDTTFNLDTSAEGSPGDQPGDKTSSDISFGEIFNPTSPIVKDRNANIDAAVQAEKGKNPLTADQEEARLSDKENGEAARATDESKPASPNPFFLQKVGMDESF